MTVTSRASPHERQCDAPGIISAPRSVEAPVHRSDGTPAQIPIGAVLESLSEHEQRFVDGLDRPVDLLVAV
jgi:hypothetical protein